MIGMGNLTTAPPRTVFKRLWAALSFGLLLASALLFLNGTRPATVRVVYIHDRSKHDGRWMSFKDPYELYAYSAFWDDRRSLGSLPMLRIVAVSEILDYRKLYCQVFYQGCVNATIIEAMFLSIGVGTGVGGRFLREYIITCPLLDEFIPHRVSLVPSLNHSSTFALPVSVPARPEVKQDFLACVSVSYWQHDPLRIIEWMELLRTFGVSKVSVYNNSLNDNASAIFKHYDHTGYVDFRQSHNFIQDPSEYNIHLHMSPVINDCMYRYMHSFKKIVVTDLDELIVPRAHATYKDMLEYIEKQQPYYHPARYYVFSNVYFFTDLPLSRTSPNDNSNLYTMKYRTRLPPSPPGYAIKSIIDPQACTNMHNHYCWGLTSLYQREGDHVDVDEKIGLNQHYKKCHLDDYDHKGKCAEVAREAVADDTMLRFKEVLAQRVNARLEEMQLNL